MSCLKILMGSDEVIYYDDVKNDFDNFIEGICRDTRKKRKIEYYNIPCSFDIETSSFYDNGEKAGCMYIWMFDIDDHIIIGRTWDEFIDLVNKLKFKLSLHPKYRILVCYIQNLGYEFQWFCKRFKWEKVFAVAEHAPLTALCEQGIEFRCSYRLSGYSLQKMGEQLNKYKVQKMVGDLDYSLIRHSKTPLTDKEMGYCINDVRVLTSYIREKIETDGSIVKIPLTKTGYVRLYCREHIYTGRSHRRDYSIYQKFMSNLTLDPEEFKMLLRAFQGGFTHASCFYSGRDEPLNEVTSFDFCSKYPSAMVAYKYPMSKGEFYTLKDPEDLKKQLSHYLCVFDVRFIGIKPVVIYDNYISVSKCSNVRNPITNNGRLVSADEIITTITSVDFEIIKKVYTWEHIEIGRFIRYEMNYLPKEFVECILDFYENKTTLKDVEGFEVEYLQYKELLNSCYGCCVTNPCKPFITYSSDLEEWTKEDLDLQKAIEKYNSKKDRFLFYPWGVFVTAYCRRDIWEHGILKAGPDYVYSDTDSVKFIGHHPNFEKEYNKMILKKIMAACRYHHIDISRVVPKTREGKLKPLGVFEFDGYYERFKTLGAKRYMVEYANDPRNGKKAGKIQITVAGLNKKMGSEYLMSFEDPFKAFTDDMEVPEGSSGRQIATYKNEPIHGVVTDYLGVSSEYDELSFLHLEESEYTMSIATEYLNYLMGIQEVYEI